MSLSARSGKSIMATKQAREDFGMSLEKYRLIFFRHYPERLDEQPGLLSSLQSFETALTLLPLKRYPHVLTTCAQALDSALRCAFDIDKDDDISLFWLLVDALEDNSVLRKRFISPKFRGSVVTEINRKYLLIGSKLDAFRAARNTFIHSGFSPDDDEESAKLLLSVGIPFLAAVYKEYFHFDLFEALRADLDLKVQLCTAISVFESLAEKKRKLMKAGFAKERQAIACLCVFSQQIDWIISPRNEWEETVLEEADSIGIKFDVVKKLRAQVEGQFGTPWTFTCPACDEYETLVCDLALAEKELPPVTIKKAICLGCHLRLPDGFFLLNNAVCQDQIDAQSEKILREHGCHV